MHCYTWPIWWHHAKKLSIKAKKQRDFHLLSKFCTYLDADELHYWYPPCKTEILEEDKERKEEGELFNDLTNDLEKVCSTQNCNYYFCSTKINPIHAVTIIIIIITWIINYHKLKYFSKWKLSIIRPLRVHQVFTRYLSIFQILSTLSNLKTWKWLNR